MRARGQDSRRAFTLLTAPFAPCAAIGEPLPYAAPPLQLLLWRNVSPPPLPAPRARRFAPEACITLPGGQVTVRRLVAHAPDETNNAIENYYQVYADCECWRTRLTPGCWFVLNSFLGCCRVLRRYYVHMRPACARSAACASGCGRVRGARARALLRRAPDEAAARVRAGGCQRPDLLMAPVARAVMRRRWRRTCAAIASSRASD